MNILVTGANGQLGREMQRLSAVSPNNYTFTDVAELNVTDAGAVRQAVAQTRAEVIVNCAAYTNVERAEEDEEAADRLNRGAAENLARAAEANGATLIHVSTDYVFDGTAHLPYTEDAPTAPLGVYGRTKLAGERAVAESGCKYLTFRTAWLYSEYGNNFLKTMLRLTAEKERLNVVFDQAGTPTYAGDLAMTSKAAISPETRASTTFRTRAWRRGTTSPRRSPPPPGTTNAASAPAARRNSRPRPPARPTRCWTKAKSKRRSGWKSPTGGSRCSTV